MSEWGKFRTAFRSACVEGLKRGISVKRISQVAVFLLSASAGFGQTVLAAVTGTITDPAGAVVPNAPISLKNTETGQVYAAASSDTGNYTVTQLPIGAYDGDFSNLINAENRLVTTASGPATYGCKRFGAPKMMETTTGLQNGLGGRRGQARGV
jgi:hypothetical protein